MAKSSPTKGGHLGHRDLKRTCLALDLMAGKRMSGATVNQRYYAELAEGSFHKTFKRDRKELESEGLHLEVESQGTAKEYWLSREKSLADVPESSEDEFKAVATMLRPLAESPSTPNREALGFAIPRIALSTCAGAGASAGAACGCDPEILRAVAEGLKRRLPLRVLYKALADGEPAWRELRAYGLFTLMGQTYVVGSRSREGEGDAMRTYNLSRAEKVEIDEGAQTYQVPSDFNVSDWQLLPFEIGGDYVRATIYARHQQKDTLVAIAPKTGSLTVKQGGAAEWQGIVRNIPAAASWCVSEGFLPLSPPELVSAWQELLEEA